MVKILTFYINMTRILNVISINYQLLTTKIEQ